MGIEYKHGLFVVDLMWRPTWAHVESLHEVLVRWKLTRQRSLLCDIDEGGMPIEEAAAVARLPLNLRIDYDQCSGEPVVAVMGPSQYGLAASDRYLQGIAVVLGVDFKVLQCETYPVVIEVPPIDDDDWVEADEYADPGGMTLYRGSWAATPPTTKVTGTFSGVWRSGVILDCGKDLPTLSEECRHPLPAQAFRAELEEALGTRLIEQGWI
jgi:hypothetical protein